MSSTLAKTKDKNLRRWIHAEHHNYFNRFASRDFVVRGLRGLGEQEAMSDFAGRHQRSRRSSSPPNSTTSRPVEAHYDVIETMPDAKLDLLLGVGHLIHYEGPDLAAKAIEDFLVDRGFAHRPTEEPRTT